MLIASSPLKTQHRKRIEALTVEYEFKCPGCNANYIGKTDRCLYTRIKEHSSHDSSEIYNHVISCDVVGIFKHLWLRFSDISRVFTGASFCLAFQ